jgi:hypothetical protein
MFIRKSSRTYKGKTYFNYVLVESVLTPKGPRQRAICSLGDLSPRPKQEWLRIARKLQAALTGQPSLLADEPPTPELEALLGKLPASGTRHQAPAQSTAPQTDLVAIHTDQVRVEEPREAGPVHVGYHFWKRLDFDRILEQAGLSERTRQLTCAMTLNRLVHPTSERAMPDWIRSTALPDLLGDEFQELAENALYRNLDRLLSKQVKIEAALAERERTLFNLDQTLFLYDLTSTYFESDEEFTPVLREPSPPNRFQKKSEIRVKLRRVGEVTYVLCLGSERKDKDRAIREAQERRLLTDLEKLKKRVARGKGKGTKPEQVLQSIGRLKERYPRVARYYRMDYDAGASQKMFDYHLDEAKRAKAEKLDGSYLLKTDRADLSADEAWRIYILLTRAEAAFRALISPLSERPIHHQKEERVDAHIFLCVLAYHLLISIEKTLLDAGVHTSWATVRETLKTHQVSTIVLPTDSGEELRIRKGSVPEPAQQELYEKLRIDPQIIRPHKHWVTPEASPK